MEDRIEILNSELEKERNKSRKYYEACCKAIESINNTNTQLCWFRCKDFTDFDEKMHIIDTDIRNSLNELSEIISKIDDEKNNIMDDEEETK